MNGYIARVKEAVSSSMKKDNTIGSASTWSVVFQSTIGSFFGIFILSLVNRTLDLEGSDMLMLVGSFGAQATLLFAAPHSPLAQPWNCVMGNTLSSFIGVSVYKIAIATAVFESTEDMFLAAPFAGEYLQLNLRGPLQRAIALFHDYVIQCHTMFGDSFEMA